MVSNQVKNEKFKGAFCKTAEEYGSSCTIHGIAYCFALGKWRVDRILWLLIVLSAIAFATYTTLIVLKDTDPILTSVETAGLPIEEVPFPSITICPQGSINEIIDAAFFKQFDDYLQEKGLHDIVIDQTNDERYRYIRKVDLEREGANFLADKYPGAKTLPIETVQILGSPGIDPDMFLENGAILNPGEDSIGCNENGLPVARITLSTLDGSKVCVGITGEVNWGHKCTNVTHQGLIMEVIPDGDVGSFVLKSHLDTYLTVGQNNQIEADNDEIETAEMFMMTFVNDSGYLIKSFENGMLVRVNKTNGYLSIGQSAETPGEFFRIQDATNDTESDDCLLYGVYILINYL